jgi:hypothetical protein
VSHDAAAIETLFVDMFLEAHRRVPAQILDLDATVSRVTIACQKFSCVSRTADDSDPR